MIMDSENENGHASPSKALGPQNHLTSQSTLNYFIQKMKNAIDFFLEPFFSLIF